MATYGCPALDEGEGERLEAEMMLNFSTRGR